MQEFRDVFSGEIQQEVHHAFTEEGLKARMDARKKELERAGFEETRRVELTERDVRRLRAANKRKKKQKRKQARQMRRLNGG